jgi:hypothetical protein
MKNWFNAFPRIARRSFLRLAGATALTQIPLVRAEEGRTAGAAEIWTSAFAGTKVWGYVNKHSVIPGEPFDLMLSTGPSGEDTEGRIEFFRIGHHPPEGQKLIWTSQQVAVTQQPVSRTAAAIGAAWLPALGEIPTANWPPGYYSADFIHAKTGVRELQVAQIVVLNPDRSNRVLLKLSPNTYQAYNVWGGHSLYPSEDESRRGTIVSFDRPTPPSFFEYEVYLARFLEELGAKHGFGVDYATDFDVHNDGAILSGYPLVIAGSHDEYWSKETFDAFENRIYRLGRNVIFPGANTAYCQVRFADVDRPPDGADLGRQLVCYKRLSDPIARRKTATDPRLLPATYFREEARRPESMLMGVAYQSWFPPTEEGPRYTYYVASTDAPFFTGLDYKVGDAAADVVGYEWDNRDPDGDGQRLWDRERSHIASLPQESIKVLFQGSPTDADGKPGRAEAVYFRSPAGAKVFTAGSIRWAWGLGKSGFEREGFKRFNENLILDFLK